MDSPTGPALERILVVDRPVDLAKLRPFWDQHATHPTVEWSSFQLLAERSENACAVAFVCGALDSPRAALIAMDERIRLPIAVGYWRVATPLVRVLTVKHGGGWLGPADPEVAREFVAAMRRELLARSATILHLDHFPVDHPVVAAALAAGATRVRPEADVNWRVAIPGSYAEFLAARSKNTRRNLKRYPERFLEEFGARSEVHEYRAPADLPRIVLAMDAVARHSYHRGLGAGFLNSPAQCALIEAALANGTYRCWVLHIDGAPAAFWDGRACAGVFYTDFTAYLPQFRDARPGWYLLSRVIEALCNSPGIDTIDFGQGDAQYKQMLGTASAAETSVALYSPSLRARSLKTLVRATTASTAVARRALQRLGLLARVKRLWRRQLSDESAKAE